VEVGSVQIRAVSTDEGYIVSGNSELICEGANVGRATMSCPETIHQGRRDVASVPERKGKKKRNTKLIHRGVLEHILEAVIENWKLGASDVQVEEVTGAQGKGR